MRDEGKAELPAEVKLLIGSTVGALDALIRRGRLPAGGGCLMQVCHDTGKMIHASKGKALAHMRGLARRTGYRAEVFRCQRCGGFHVGGSPRSKGRGQDPKRRRAG